MPVPCLSGGLPIFVLFHNHDCERRVHAKGGSRGGVVGSSVHSDRSFYDATVRGIGRAFDAACKELNDTGQPAVVHEVMFKRIIAAAQRGERDVTQLRDAALIGIRKPRNEIRGESRGFPLSP